MDPIESIRPEKDSTYAMLLAAQKRGWEVSVMNSTDLVLSRGAPMSTARTLSVQDGESPWFAAGSPERRQLSDFDVILMRKDPPFDLNYIAATYVLEHAEARGVLVVNRPRALRDANEKVFASWFPECSPETLISASLSELRGFMRECGSIVVKPLDLMGGRSVLVLHPGDVNASVVFEEMTRRGTRFIQAQRYLPELSESGDKRILLIDGEPVPYALVRMPQAGESRANLAAGGAASGRPLTERDRWICDRIAPELRRRGLWFVGIDVIGDWLTEINVTSPTGIRELDKFFQLDIAGDFLDCVKNLCLREKR